MWAQQTWMSNDSPFLSSNFRGAFEQGATPPTALMELLSSQQYKSVAGLGTSLEWSVQLCGCKTGHRWKKKQKKKHKGAHST